MAKLSVIIPSRDERFLVPTIEDIFRNARGEIEVVAVLDSDKWPDNWADVTAKYPNLHTIHNGKSRGMRFSINRGVASAISRRAKFIMKTDAHCSFSEGFDEVLKAECEPNWVVIPRRGRLDPEKWIATDTHKPDIDYHYLSFPDDPNDFGGPGLNGKVWAERAVERKDILIDEEMSSQGSCWFMHAKYFNELELMDEANYGMFWNEMQEIGLKAWLSGGQLTVNKKAKYLHLHKGRTYGRGYKLPESELTKGATFTKRWLFNEAWPKQTLPFKSLIERFWPVPTWPEDWEEKVYQGRGKVWPGAAIGQIVGNVPNMEFSGPLPSGTQEGDLIIGTVESLKSQLQIHSARYGILNSMPPFADKSIDVADRLQQLVKDDSLDIVVSNDTLTPGQNPFRGKKKVLLLTYSINGGEQVTIERQEKEWLIIGGTQQWITGEEFQPLVSQVALTPEQIESHYNAALAMVEDRLLMTAAALNDYLIRKFHISDRRLRAPMPVELRDFNRNDLAKLFAELGFTCGAEIGVAEGHYSEILVKANPQLELWCIDPWDAYDGNAQQKSKEKHKYALDETYRKLANSNAIVAPTCSMDFIYGNEYENKLPDSSLDFVYIDGNHSFDYVMQDLIEWSKKVRSGGIVSGDDYYELDRKRWGAGPVEAVQAYTKAHAIPLWFICDAPNSVDFFFVKL